MHNHDHDLIFSVANAELDGSDLDAATAEIAGCAECSMELELQLAGVALLAEVARPSLALDERNALRAGIQDQLGLVAPQPVIAAPRRKGIRNWGPIAVAAVALTGVVLVAPQLGLLGGSDDAADFTASATIAPQDEGALAPVQSLSSVDEAADLKEAPPEESVAAAPADTIASASAEAIDGQAMYVLEELTIEELEALQTNPPDVTLERGLVPTAVECADSGLEEFEAEIAMPLATGAYEGVEAVAIVYEFSDQQDAIIAIHDATTCEVLASTQ